MKVRINALAEQVFKAPVHIAYPTEKFDEKGNTVYGQASFIGRFKTISQDAGLKNLEDIELAQKEGTAAVVSEMIKQVEQIFIGFEPMPGKEFPLLDDNGEPVAVSPEAIKTMLRISEVRDAVNKAYAHARNPSIIEENLKK